MCKKNNKQSDSYSQNNVKLLYYLSINFTVNFFLIMALLKLKDYYYFKDNYVLQILIGMLMAFTALLTEKIFLKEN